MEVGGEYDKTKTGFQNLAAVMVISIFADIPRSRFSVQ